MAVDNGTNETNGLADHPDQSEFQESQDIFGGLPTTLHDWPQKEHKDDGEKNKSEERTDKDISNDDDWMFIFNTGWQTPPEPELPSDSEEIEDNYGSNCICEEYLEKCRLNKIALAFRRHLI
ncbi:hypothetical protein O0L34_g19380 [Tuta absoluta]|nr:hypothetical protein O0L34_g19380 [Tuta absoluta]